MKERIIFYGCPHHYPIRDIQSFSAIVNVSDTPGLLFDSPRVPYYWFPIHETGAWGYSPFFGAAKVYDYYKDNEEPLMIHCHGGACRSPLVAYAILLSDGLSEEEMGESYKGFSKEFQLNIDRGCIPHDIVAFLKARHWKPEFSIMGLLQSIGSQNLYLPTFKRLRGAKDAAKAIVQSLSDQDPKMKTRDLTNEVTAAIGEQVPLLKKAPDPQDTKLMEDRKRIHKLMPGPQNE